MSTIIWGLGAWVLFSVPLGLIISRGVMRMNPPCEIADTTNWDDIRSALAGMLAGTGAAPPANAARSASADVDAEWQAAAFSLPAARKVA